MVMDCFSDLMDEATLCHPSMKTPLTCASCFPVLMKLAIIACGNAAHVSGVRVGKASCYEKGAVLELCG